MEGDAQEGEEEAALPVSPLSPETNKDSDAQNVEDLHSEEDKVKECIETPLSPIQEQLSDVENDNQSAEKTAKEDEIKFYDGLPEVHPPFLPRKNIMDHPYTLVLDLDETLIHFVSSDDAEDEKLDSELGNGEEENDFFYMVRPYCNKFLSELSQYFEIIIFTAAMQDYADWIVAGIDQRNYISHRLYRQHCRR